MQRVWLTHGHERITEELGVVDLVLVLAAGLLVAVFGGLIAEHRRLRKTQAEYEKARGAVEDIVLSFSRQFKRESERLQLVAYKVETFSARSDRALAKAEEVNQGLKALDGKLDARQADHERITSQLSAIDKLARDVITSQETLTARLSSIEDRTDQASVRPGAAIQMAIPIRRDKALAPLTGTELAALEILANEGSRTAPEIRERVRLSREHTARLMKKLYEEGYLERDPSKIPFRYSVKKEMADLLKKTDSGVV